MDHGSSIGDMKPLHDLWQHGMGTGVWITRMNICHLRSWHSVGLGKAFAESGFVWMEKRPGR